jgi:hypothetical protein
MDVWRLFKRKLKLKVEGDPYVNIPSGVELRLAGSPGSAGQVLTSQGSGANPTWADPLTAAEVWSYSTRTLTRPAGLIPNDNILLNNATERGTNNTTYTKLKETRLGIGGGIRTYFEFKSGTGVTVYARVYRNDSAYGTTRSTTSMTYVAVTEDLVFTSGDLYQIYGYTSTSGGSVYVQNQQVRGIEGIGWINPSY